MPNLVIPKPEELNPGLLLSLGLPLPKLESLALADLPPPANAKPKKPKAPKVEHTPESKVWQAAGKPLVLAPAATSPALYSGIHTAFDHFHKELFGNTPLPDVMFTLQRKPKSHGYFKGSSFAAAKTNGGEHVLPDLCEIAMHPESLKRSSMEVLSTLAHEMVHLWQWAYGKPGKKGYHNPEWAKKMLAVGLMPKALGKNGEPNGKQTGAKVTHEVIEGGAFHKAAIQLLGNGWALSHYAKADVKPEGKASRNGVRVKYVCPECESAMWGKRGMILKCKGSSEGMHGSSHAMIYKGMAKDFAGKWSLVTSQTYTSGAIYQGLLNEIKAEKEAHPEQYEYCAGCGAAKVNCQCGDESADTCGNCGEYHHNCSCDGGPF